MFGRKQIGMLVAGVSLATASAFAFVITGSPGPSSKISSPSEEMRETDELSRSWSLEDIPASASSLLDDRRRDLDRLEFVRSLSSDAKLSET